MLARRLDQARHLLASTPLSVKEVAERVGYDNPLYFSRVFSSQMQVTPSDYRAANQWAAPQRKSTPGARRPAGDLRTSM
jgi:AraC-like DNA-binding protein